LRSRPTFDKSKFEPLSDDDAKDLFINEQMDANQDVKKNSNVVFLNGNELWCENMGKFDVLGIDAKNIPEYNKVPSVCYPDQVFKVKTGNKMNFYKGSKDGIPKKIFPPKKSGADWYKSIND